RRNAPGMLCGLRRQRTWFASTGQHEPGLREIHDHTLHVLTSRTLEGALIVIGFVRLNVIEPHPRAAHWASRSIHKRFFRIERANLRHKLPPLRSEVGPQLVSRPPARTADGVTSMRAFERVAHKILRMADERAMLGATAFAAPQHWRTYVRFGSEAEMCSALRYVRFARDFDRESGHQQEFMSALPPKAD